MKKLITILAACAVALGCSVGAAACANGGKKYSVDCQSSENGVVVVADKSVKAGEKVILGARPDKGYKLTSFMLDGEALDGCSFVMPQRDVKVSAVFEVITYSVTYVLGEATVVGNNPETYTAGSATELISPQKEGCEICGWYRYFTEDLYDYWDIQAIENYKVTSLDGLYGNLTLYAKYYNPPHSISYTNSDNGNFYLEDYAYEAYYGETYNVIVQPYAGYELDYISVNGTPIEGTSFVAPAEDLELSAEFKPIEYEITYVLNGGVNSPDNPAFYTVETYQVYLHYPEKEGWEFDGWYFDENFNEPVYDGYFISENYLSPLTLYAKFIDLSEFEWDNQ